MKVSLDKTDHATIYVHACSADDIGEWSDRMKEMPNVLEHGEGERTTTLKFKIGNIQVCLFT